MVESDNTDVKFIDLFCGARGLSLGFEESGFNLALANDIDKYSIETFKFNRPAVGPKKVFRGEW